MEPIQEENIIESEIESESEYDGSGDEEQSERKETSFLSIFEED